jgi:hypothetical protein
MISERCLQTGKTCYDKRGAATARHDPKIKSRIGRYIRIYACGYCQRWHLTTHTRGRVKIK